jgi:GNAT superfamily N-acetyltransferase
MTEPSIEPFARAHLDGLIALVAAQGWTEYTEDPERTHRALSGPGVTTLVALADGRVVGAIQVQSDGVIQAHVSMLLIDAEWRGHQLGTRLLRQGLSAQAACGSTSAPGPRGTTSALARAARSAFASRVRTSGRAPEPHTSSIATASCPTSRNSV